MIDAGPDSSIVSDQIHSTTDDYLEAITHDAFKRQVDLDESIWRSLPFFSATLALAAAVIGSAATSVPHAALSLLSIALYFCLAAAALALGWSLRWLWSVVRPRDYEYPAPAGDIAAYADALRQFHGSESDVESRVKHDLKRFMIAQYADAEQTNFNHNEQRMKARSLALLYMMAALGLAFACEVPIFIARALMSDGTRTETRRDETVDRTRDSRGRANDVPAGAAKSDTGPAGGQPVRSARGGPRASQAMSDPGTSPAPAPAPAPPPPPPPPPPRILKKNE